MASSPFFSVIIPTYNRKRYLLEAIDSVLKQSFKGFEIIVVDDGSTDGTKIFFESNNFDHRIKYVRQSNSGVSVARNTGVSNSNGNYICYLDSDDLWHPDKLDNLYKIIQKNDSCDLIFHDFHKHNAKLPQPYLLSNTQIFPYILEIYNKVDDRVWLGNGDLSFELLLRGYPLYPSTVCIKKYIHDNYRWDPCILKSEDFNFFIKLSLRYKFLYLDVSLTTIRIHDNNKSNDLLTKNRVVLNTIKMISLLYCTGKKQSLAKKHLVNLYFLNGIHHIKRREFARGFSLIFSALFDYRFYFNRIKKMTLTLIEWVG